MKKLLASTLLAFASTLLLPFAADAAPTISRQPTATQSVDAGSNVTLSVAATGSGTLSYQWQKDGVDLPEKISATISLTNVQPAHIGYYTCKVTDSVGTTTSAQATLNLNGVPFGIWQGLVGYYPFDGNADDRSLSGLDGIVSGAVLSVDRFGQTDSCYEFSRTGDGIGNAVANRPIWHSFTVSVWFKAGEADTLQPESDGGTNYWYYSHFLIPAQNGLLTRINHGVRVWSQ